MQCVAFSLIAIVGVCQVCVGMCPYASLVDYRKTVWDNPAIFCHHLILVHKKKSHIFGDVVAHDLDLFFKVKDSNPNHFGKLNLIIVQWQVQQTLLVITQEVTYFDFDWYTCI